MRINSKKSGYIYDLYKDRIEVQCGADLVVIPMPQDAELTNLEFYFMYFDKHNQKIRVVIARSKGFDVQYVIDEDTLTLTEEAPFK